MDALIYNGTGCSAKNPCIFFTMSLLVSLRDSYCVLLFKVSGLPTPDISWQVNGRVIRSDSSHKMLVRENGVHSLIIEPVTARDAGIYTCVATNRAGQNTFSLELIVAGNFSI